jgi:hypothetical protein
MDERTRLHGLVVRAVGWVGAIERLSNAAVENKMYDAHMCALALHHLKRCVDFIKKRRPPTTVEGKRLLKAFTDACRKANIQRLRNALEHEEQHFYGSARDPNMNYRGEDFSPPAIAYSKTKRLRRIYILDVWYEIGEAADAAIALEGTLLELAERTWPGKAVGE